MKEVLAVILGGGRGTRLFPLTAHRSKPAVPIGGKYRLIDIPISNCLNSHLRRIIVLTQYLSESLNKHLAQTYRFDPFTEAFVSVIAAEQTENEQEWFLGTADAVRRANRHIRHHDFDDVLIHGGNRAAATTSSPAHEIYEFGGWSLDATSRELKDEKGVSRELTTAEFNLLEMFARRPHRALTRDEIMDILKGHDYSPLDRSIDALVSRVRRKIDNGSSTSPKIKSLRGIGYMFTSDVRRRKA